MTDEPNGLYRGSDGQVYYRRNNRWYITDPRPWMGPMPRELRVIVLESDEDQS